MSPDPVINKVQTDYLNALAWMQESALWPDTQIAYREAAHFLTESFLRRFRQRIHQSVSNYRAVLRADHQLQARHFSPDGVRCLVIDQQTDRRMATYFDGRRLHTQDLGSCAFVYEMVYDRRARRWKIATFIQQLPLGWGHPKLNQRMDVQVDWPEPPQI
jgi:hypothetical protein